MDTWAISKAFVVAIAISISYYLKKRIIQTSLEVHLEYAWQCRKLRFHPQSTCHGTAKLEHQNCWSPRAHALQQEKPL